MKNRHGVDVSAIRVGDYITHDDDVGGAVPGRWKVLVTDSVDMRTPVKVEMVDGSGSTQSTICNMERFTVYDRADDETGTVWVSGARILSHEPAPVPAPPAPACVLDHLHAAIALLHDSQPGTPRAGIRDRVLAIVDDIEAAVDLAALATPSSGGAP